MFTFIGKLITQMREEHTLSLEELATRSGISVEKLTDIESGKINPSIGVLIKISRALGARLGTLLDGQENYGAVVTRAREAIPSNNAGSPSPASEHLNFYSLAQGKSDRHMEPFIIEVAQNTSSNELKSEHEGEEFLHVIDGTIEVRYGAEVHRLERGDSIYYDSIVPHVINNVSTQPARILAVIYTPY